MKFTKTKLPSGLRIITVPLKDSQTTTVMTLVETGSDYEDKKVNGISHFLEHMCFKGTEKRSLIEIIEGLEGIGAYTNAFTSDEFTGYYAKAHYSKTSKLIDIISDIYLNSTLPKEEIEKERGVILQEINMYEDMPQRTVFEVLAELMYGDQPAGRTTLGPKKNIKSITREDFLNYRKQHYVAKGTVMIVAGRIDEKEVIKEVKESFKDISRGKKTKKPKVIEKQSKPQLKIKQKKTEQVHLLFGFRTFNRYDKREPSAILASTILGKGLSSRLFKRMRDDLGLCYYVKADASTHIDHGVFTIRAGVGPDKVLESVKVILEEVKKIRDKKVSEKELKKAKEYFTGNMAMHLESSDEIGAFIGFQELFHDKKIETLKEKVKKIKEVTAEDVQKVSKQIFKNKNLNLAIVGDIKSPSKIKKLLSL